MNHLASVFWMISLAANLDSCSSAKVSSPNGAQTESDSENANDKSAKLAEFKCHGKPSTRKFAPDDVIIDGTAQRLDERRTLLLKGDGTVTATLALGGEPATTSTQQLNSEDLNKVLYEMFDVTCLGQIQRENVAAKVKAANNAYLAAGGVNHTTTITGCEGPRIAVHLDGKHFVSEWSCNDFNLINPKADRLAEAKYVEIAEATFRDLFDATKGVLPAPQMEELGGDGRLVCCNFFGFGSLMKRCCESFKRVPRSECEGMIPGGGREIADDAQCQ